MEQSCRTGKGSGNSGQQKSPHTWPSRGSHRIQTMAAPFRVPLSGPRRPAPRTAAAPGPEPTRTGTRQRGPERRGGAGTPGRAPPEGTPGPGPGHSILIKRENGHQHEVSEKRLAPGAYPCRLDMEICICGVRRSVDQDGTPATPWQSINLGPKPGGNEGAGVAPRAPPKSAMDGLITCGSCGQPMLLDDTQGDQEACYACQSRCPTPRGCTPAPTGMNRPWNSQSSRPCGQTPRVRVNPDGGPVLRLRGGKPRQDGG